MANNSNAARNYNMFPEDEEPRQANAGRRTVPQPIPTFRMVGTDAQLTRSQAAPPSVLPPPSGPRRQPTGQANVPPMNAPGFYGYAEDRTRRAPVRQQQPQQQIQTNRRPMAEGRGLPRINFAISGSNVRFAMMIAGVIGVLLVSYLVVSFAVKTWQTWQDDMTYGRPRITRLEAPVGHNEVGGNKTIFVAQNLRGQISITEFPGGDPTKTRVIVGPQLFGKERELIPIKLSVKDVNLDGQADLIATADDQQYVYINENGNFRPINEQERLKLRVMEKEDGK